MNPFLIYNMYKEKCFSYLKRGLKEYPTILSDKIFLCPTCCFSIDFRIQTEAHGRKSSPNKEHDSESYFSVNPAADHSQKVLKVYYETSPLHKYNPSGLTSRLSKVGHMNRYFFINPRYLCSFTLKMF